MRKTIIGSLAVFLALAILTSCSRAEDSADPKITKARALIVATDTMTNALTMLRTVLPTGIEAQKQAHPEVSDAFWTEFSKVFNEQAASHSDELMEQMASIYARHFSEEEMDELLKFYQTDIGKKSLREMPSIFAEATKVGQDWGKKIGEQAGQIAGENLRKQAIKPQ